MGKEIIKNYEKIARETPMLKKLEEIELIKNVQKKNCAESRNRITYAYLRTAISLAKKYQNNTNLELEDLINAAILGIQRSLENFDLSKYKTISKNGPSLFSYYTYRSILMSLNDEYRSNLRQFSVSDSTNLRLTNINKLYKQGLLNDKSPDEIIEFVSKTLNIKIKEVKILVDLFKKPVELDKEIEESGGPDNNHTEYKDLILKTHVSENPSNILDQNDRKNQLLKELNNLPPEERNLIFHRYGINCDKNMTFAEIGAKYKTSGQNVKNKIDKIQNKLKVSLEKVY